MPWEAHAVSANIIVICAGAVFLVWWNDSTNGYVTASCYCIACLLLWLLGVRLGYGLLRNFSQFCVACIPILCLINALYLDGNLERGSRHLLKDMSPNPQEAFALSIVYGSASLVVLVVSLVSWVRRPVSLRLNILVPPLLNLACVNRCAAFAFYYMNDMEKTLVFGIWSSYLFLASAIAITAAWIRFGTLLHACTPHKLTDLVTGFILISLFIFTAVASFLARPDPKSPMLQAHMFIAVCVISSCLTTLLQTTPDLLASLVFVGPVNTGNTALRACVASICVVILDGFLFTVTNAAPYFSSYVPPWSGWIGEAERLAWVVATCVLSFTIEEGSGSMRAPQDYARFSVNIQEEGTCEDGEKGSFFETPNQDVPQGQASYGATTTGRSLPSTPPQTQQPVRYVFRSLQSVEDTGFGAV